MKRLLQLVLIFAALGILPQLLPHHHTWTCVQGSTGCTSTTPLTCSTAAGSCIITVGATVGGNVGVLAGQSNGSSTTLSSASAGGFTCNAADRATDGTAGETNVCYSLNLTGGVTTITCSFTVSASNQCVFYEFHASGSGLTRDTGGGVDHTVACTSCSGAVLTTTTANNYLLIQSCQCRGTATAIDQSYVIWNASDSQNAAYKMNVSSGGTTPNWTQSSSQAAGAGTALYEVVSGSSTAGFDKRRRYEVLEGE